MARIFSIIAAISALMVLLASGGTYWFSSAGADSAERAAVALAASSIANGLSSHLSTLQLSADGVAQSSDVIAALQSGNPELIQTTANKLQGIVPHALRLRLLPPNINEPDQSQLPHMGFGDLEMVRAALSGKPKPVIQGEGEHRHLAITSPVLNNQQVIGVVLVSIKPDILQQALGKLQFDDGLIELKQDQLTLASLGQSNSKDEDPQTLQLANSRWQINFWPNISGGFSHLALLGAIIAIPALLACLSFFMGYRKLTEFLRQDQGSVLKAAKDMMQGKNVGNYPVHLDEMQPIIASLAQFKRVLDQENTPPEQRGGKEYDFFDESFDIDFLEESTPISTEMLANAANMTSTSAAFDQSAGIADVMPEMSQAEVLVTSGSSHATVSMPSNESWDFDLKTAPIAHPETSSAPTQAITTAAATADSTSIYRDYDIRGIVGHNLNEEIVTNIGCAFASEAKQHQIKTIVVGRDGRLSSPILSEALIKGIISTGCNVLDIGLVPTPVLYFVAHHTEGRCGLMVTAGHHPAEYNGIKLMMNDDELGGEQLATVKRRIDKGDYSFDNPGSVEQNTLFSNEYIGIIADDTHIVRPMTVVVDCGNGATGQLAPMLLKTIGCDVVELNCDIDGRFPSHQPDPSRPEHLEALIKAVKLNNADVGICFDGDGDRMGLVDSGGKIIWPDRQMMLFARDVLASRTGAEIIYDAGCTKHLPEQIAKRGGRAMLCQNNPSAMRGLLKESAAALAGAMSGRFFFNDRWFGFDDGLYAAVRMIEILSADMRASSELFDDLPDSVNTPELRVAIANGEADRLIEQMINQANFDAVSDNTDGIKIEFADGWGLARASSDHSALVMRFEADSREAMSRIQAQFKFLMLQIKPDLSLPF